MLQLCQQHGLKVWNTMFREGRTSNYIQKWWCKDTDIFYNVKGKKCEGV